MIFSHATQWGLLSDKTVQFVSDPSMFVERMCQETQSRVFTCRLLARQTIVIADHKMLISFLNKSQKHFRNGLNDFAELFGDSIMFAEEETAIELKKILLPLFNEVSVDSYENILTEELEDWAESIDLTRDINLYEEFKNISLSYNVSIFMGVRRKADQELFETIKDLSSVHWHGVVSLPVNISLPLFGQGGYRKAINAKKKLQEIMKDRLSSDGSAFFEKFQNNKGDVLTEELLFNHMLLFSCALIPKAVGSVLVMFYELRCKWEHLLQPDGGMTEEDLQCVLLEVMRLYPPFIGGVKVADVDTEVGPYHCPKDVAVYYSFMAAMRDPAVFLYPEEFLPNRWRNVSEREKHLVWGGGLHSCVGKIMSWRTILTMARFTLERFSITKKTEQRASPDIKHLPVLRPSNSTAFIFSTKQVSGTDSTN